MEGALVLVWRGHWWKACVEGTLVVGLCGGGTGGRLVWRGH